MLVDIDVLTILGPGRQIDKRVLDALDKQGMNLELKHIVHCGGRFPNERIIDAIVRSRNEAKDLITAPYTLLLDDDIVIPPKGVDKLIGALIFNPTYAAIGINCRRILNHHHVSMSAVLFYSTILRQIRFRSEKGKCECQCCCDDLRGMGYAIGYLPLFRTIHLDGRRMKRVS